MRGQLIIRDFLIFVVELIVVFIALLTIIKAGETAGDYIFNYDSRIIQESLISFEAGAEIAPSDFSATLRVPPNPYSIIMEDVKNDEKNYVLAVKSQRLIFQTPEAQTQVKEAPSMYLTHFLINKIEENPSPGMKLSESSKWDITIKKTVKKGLSTLITMSKEQVASSEQQTS